MKLKTMILGGLSAVMLSLSSCAGLGFGVDVDSAGVSPYFYGNNYFGPLSVGASWNGGPLGGPLWGNVPSAPPVVGNGPGSIGMAPPAPAPKPQPTRPPQQANPPQQTMRPPQNFAPSQQQPPLEVGPDLRPINNGPAPMNRPGNYGLPN